MKAKPKQYEIDSFERLCNIVNEKNVLSIAKDLALWLVYYEKSIRACRKSHPKGTNNYTNWQIARGSFIWIDDGKNEISETHLVKSDTGEKIIHKGNTKKTKRTK